jgi:predicted Zn finger-like uncharacterized protein
MPLPEPQTVIISCPHCSTRYQVAYGTIGTKGRTVQCAHCQKSWHAKAEPPVRPPLAAVPKRAIELEDKNVHFGELAERLLDEQFTEEERRAKARRAATKQAEFDEEAAKVAAKLAEEARAAAERLAAKAAAQAGGEGERGLADIRAAIAPKAADTATQKHDPTKHHLQQLAFWRRQASMNDSLPIARMRRTARMAGVAALMVVVGGGVIFRFPIVQQFPQLAGIYQALGLGVNVVGLAFRDVHTLKALQQGSEVLMVDAKIYSVSSQQVTVPPVVVTLVGPNGNTVYEWSVVPKAAELEPGEVVSFETQVTAPPEGANRVSLSFATNGTAPKPADSVLGPPLISPASSDPGKP